MDTSQSTVEYRPVPNFPGYRVGNDGSVWSSHANRHGPRGTWRRLATYVNYNGYETVGLWHINRRYLRLVSIVVLEGFVGPRPHGLWGLHKNDLRLDNRLENLYWGTKADNIRDAKNNNRLFGPGIPLTKGEVIAIRLLTEQGVSQTEISRRLGLGLSTVRSIITGRTHKNGD